MAILSWTLPIGKSSLEQEPVEQVRAQLKALIEKAPGAERDRYRQFGFYEHAPQFRLEYRNCHYLRDFVTRVGLLRRLRIPHTRRGFRPQILLRYQRRQEAVNELLRRAFPHTHDYFRVADDPSHTGPELWTAYSTRLWLAGIERQCERVGADVPSENFHTGMTNVVTGSGES